MSLDPPDEEGVDDEGAIFPIGAFLDVVGRDHLDHEAERAAQAAFSALKRDRKTPPAALDHERAVLGAIMLDGARVFDEVTKIGLAHDHFFRQAHQTVFRAFTKLRADEKPIDTLTVVDVLNDAGQLDSVGGAAAIAQLEAMLPTSAHAANYAERLIELATRRRMIELAQEIATEAFTVGGNSENILARSRTQLELVTIPRRSPVRDAIAKARQDLAANGVGKRRAPRDEFLGEDIGVLMDTYLPRVDWLVRGLLTAGAVACLAGEAKGAKTWFALELLIKLALGQKVFDHFDVPCGRQASMAVFAEDGKQSLKNRVGAVCQGIHMDPRELAGWMNYTSLQSVDLRDPEDCALIVASARAMKRLPAVIYFDPLRDVIGGADENSPPEMSAVMHNLRAIRNVTGATTMFAHHFGKPSKDKAGLRLADRMRGTTVIRAALDNGIYLELKGKTASHWKNVVDVDMKPARGAGVFGLELDISDDLEGTAVAAGWQYHHDPAAIETSDAERKLAGADRVLTILRDEHMSALKKNREPMPMSASTIGQLMNAPRTTVGDWLRVLAQKGLADVHSRGFTFRPQDKDD